jgi:DNA-binding IscR family transcriptional regulator
MNANAVHEFLLGDRQLHARFSMAIELLAHVAVAAPHPVRAAALSAALGQPRMVRILLANLQQSGLLCRHERAKDAWCGAPGFDAITLADVFRSMCGAGLESPRKTQACDEPRGSSQQGIELLLMQATMQINQVVLQHLQTFDLGRLKAVGPATARPRSDSSTRAYIAEPV